MPPRGKSFATSAIVFCTGGAISSISVAVPSSASSVRIFKVRVHNKNGAGLNASMSLRSQLFRFPSSVKRDPSIEAWMRQHPGELGEIAKHWFEIMRQCGDDVREVLHDGHPTACVADAAFAYVNAFKAHVNVGFFRGAELTDPARLLEGTGKFMRHVKVRPGSVFDAVALSKLIGAAYTEMKGRVRAESLRAGFRIE
jgi:hypothetical protein